LFRDRDFLFRNWDRFIQNLAHIFQQFHRLLRTALSLSHLHLNFVRALNDQPPNPSRQPEISPRHYCSLGDYQVHFAQEGFASIQQISSGEIMHSRTDPMEEARSLYIEQSNLVQRLKLSADENGDNVRPLLIWDVGLGAAANAMGAVYCYEKEASSSRVRPLRIVSFENDLASLRLAFRYRCDFRYLRHCGPAAIVKKGSWKSEQHSGLEWSLLLGDFLETMGPAPGPPDLIYYDMFSTKTSSELWSHDAFRKLDRACSRHPAELFTYTCSTANRAAMLGAGFYVARGRNAGHKLETTIALTPAAYHSQSPYRHPLLGHDWLRKWHRSRARFPHDLAANERASFEQRIVAHPQFAD
jgi:queuine tRNA-ribosyltransferase